MYNISKIRELFNVTHDPHHTIFNFQIDIYLSDSYIRVIYCCNKQVKTITTNISNNIYNKIFNEIFSNIFS